VYIDDYAHHPTEINGASSSSRVVSKSKVLAISSLICLVEREIFADAKSLSAFDEIHSIGYLSCTNCLWKE
jgi:UDP-N-acetylmuramate-alanine ligase